MTSYPLLARDWADQPRICYLRDERAGQMPAPLRGRPQPVVTPAAEDDTRSQPATAVSSKGAEDLSTGELKSRQGPGLPGATARRGAQPPPPQAPRCGFCRKRVHRQRNGAWYHDHNASVFCKPGESGQEAFPLAQAATEYAVPDVAQPDGVTDAVRDYRTSHGLDPGGFGCDIGARPGMLMDPTTHIAHLRPATP